MIESEIHRSERIIGFAVFNHMVLPMSVNRESKIEHGGLLMYGL